MILHAEKRRAKRSLDRVMSNGHRLIARLFNRRFVRWSVRPIGTSIDRLLIASLLDRSIARWLAGSIARGSVGQLLERVIAPPNDCPIARLLVAQSVGRWIYRILVINSVPSFNHSLVQRSSVNSQRSHVASLIVVPRIPVRK